MSRRTAVQAVITLCLTTVPLLAQDTLNLRPKLVVYPANGNPVTLQPAPGANTGTDEGTAAAGKDGSYMVPSPVPYNGDEPIQVLFNSSCNGFYGTGFVRFSLAGLPTAVTKAEVWTYTWVFFNGNGWPWYGPGVTVSLRQVASPWTELSPPESYSGTPISPYTVSVLGGSNGTGIYTEYEGWIKFDITDLYRQWVTGTANLGLAIAQDNDYCVNGDITYVFTSDWPKPGGVAGPASAQAGTESAYLTGGATVNETPYSCNNLQAPECYSYTIPIEYRFDWGDGTTSDWLPGSCVDWPGYQGRKQCTASSAHTWNTGGDFIVKAQARAAQRDDLAGPWTSGYAVNVAGPADMSAPVIAYSIAGTVGPGGWYTSDVTVTWSVTDPESAIALATGCDPITLTASATLVCSATNAAGLSASVPLTVNINKSSPAGYDAIRAMCSGCVTKPGILNSLLTKLNNAEAAQARGDLTAKAGMLGAFINEVQAQAGKAIPAKCAAELVRLAGLL
jgi:hypothetical protein